VNDWKAQLQGLDVVNMIRAFRKNLEETRDAETEKALLSLQSGQNPEDVLRSLARNLTNKLMHTPSRRLKQAGEQGRKDHIRLASDLFGLQESNEDEVDQ
jgi:glutamyl-tRNA reductase